MRVCRSDWVWLLAPFLLALPAAGQVTLEGFTCVGSICTPASPLSCDSPTTLAMTGNAITVPSGGGCFDVDPPGTPTTTDLTGITCTAGDSFTLRAENDNETVVAKASSLAVYGAVDQSLDQDGDYSLWTCPATNAPVMWGFLDESGVVTASAFESTGPGIGLLTLQEGAAPTAPAAAGEHSAYFDLTEGRLCSIENGQSAQCYALAGEAGGGSRKFRYQVGAGQNNAWRPAPGWRAGSPGPGWFGTTFTTFAQFDPSTDQTAYFTGHVLTDEFLSTDSIVVDLYLMNGGGGGAGATTRWDVAARCLGPGELFGAPTNAADSSTSSGFTASALTVHQLTLAGTEISGCAAEELLLLEVTRDADHVNDTWGQNAQLWKLVLEEVPQ